MDKAKQWGALTALAAVVIVAAGWFLLISPERGEATELREQSAAQELQNDQLAAQLEVLRTKAAQLPRERAALAAVATKIPAEPALPALLRALTAQARSAGVELVSVTPGPAAPVETAATAPAVPAPPADGTAPPAPAAPPAAVAATAGLQSIPLTMQVVGDFYDIEAFVAGLEDLPRALRVTAVSLAPGVSPLESERASLAEDGRSLTSTIAGQVYLAPPAPAPAPGSGPTASAPATGTAPPASGATSTAPAS